MKTIKRLIVIMISFLLVLSSFYTVYADEPDAAYSDAEASEQYGDRSVFDRSEESMIPDEEQSGDTEESAEPNEESAEEESEELPAASAAVVDGYDEELDDEDYNVEDDYEYNKDEEDDEYYIKDEEDEDEYDEDYDDDYDDDDGIYTITYVLNGGTNNKNNPVTYDGDDYEVILNNPTRAGYLFDGWYYENGEKLDWDYDWDYYDDEEETVVYYLDASIQRDVTVTAKWSIVRYRIKYVLDGGSNNPDNPSVYNVNSEITFGAPTKKGYKFAGWYTDKHFKNKITAISEGTFGNKTLYALWNANAYTIVFKRNGGTGSMTSMNMVYGSSKALKLNQFKAKKNYHFVEWNTKANGSGTSYKNGASVKNLTAKKGGTVKLYAIWKINTYTVKFVNTGGKGNMPSQVYKYGKTYKLPKNTFTSKGGVFAGWNTKKNGKGKTYKNKASIKNLSSKNGAVITLYTMWKYPATKVLINGLAKARITMAAGHSEKLDVALKPVNSTDKYTFTSSNPSVVSVSKKGVVTARTNGIATITVKSTSGKTATCTVTVEDNVHYFTDAENDFYRYGVLDLYAVKAAYSGGNLVVDMLVKNKSSYKMKKFYYITISVYDYNGNLIGHRFFSNKTLNMAGNSSKIMRYTIKNPVWTDLRGPLSYDYEYDEEWA